MTMARDETSMAHVKLRRPSVELESPWLVEGLPGLGLVGKIATDHLVETLEMDHYADVLCEGLPRIGVYGDGYTVRQPVRLYADPDRNLLALQSDVPVSPTAANEFASCVTNWLADNGVTPAYLSGTPAEKGPEPPSMFGIATGDAGDLLADADVAPPGDPGAISGPTGALVNRAQEADFDAVALVVESDPQFPDPEAARILLEKGIEPVVGVDVEVSELVDRTEEIQRQKETLAKRMQEAGDEATKAQPLRMYQ